MLGLCCSSSSVCDDHLFESHRAKKVKSGGSDPTFLRAIRPKVSWGALPPLQALRVDELRGDRAGPRFCQTMCPTLFNNRKENVPSPSLNHPHSNQPPSPTNPV